MKFLFVVVIFFLQINLCLLAAGENSGESSNLSLTFLPYVIYTPETEFAFGVTGVLSLYPEESNPFPHPDIYGFNLMMTQKKQSVFSFSPTVYFRDNQYKFMGYYAYRNFPNNFYGIGNFTKKSDELEITLKEWQIHSNILRRISRDFAIGAGFLFNSFTVENFGKKDNELFFTDLSGNGLNGLELILNYDSRNHFFIPSKGMKCKVSYILFNKLWGSDFESMEFSIDTRGFFFLYERYTLAFQNIIILQSGDIPFVYLTKLGGENILRGFYEGRFREKNLAFHQVEIRFPVIGRVSMTSFIGFGQVMPKISSYNFSNYHAAAGMGLRYNINRRTGVNVRADLAFTNDSTGLYIGLLEAF